MKSTGIVRPIDGLGRIVIPIEIRNTMQIEPGSPLEIYTAGDQIVLRKYTPTCVFCGGAELTEMTYFHGKRICQNCLAQLHTLKTDEN